MKNPEPTLLTHEIVCTFPGFTGLTRKGSRPPGLVAASSDELYGPFSEAATRPSPFKIQALGFGVERLSRDSAGLVGRSRKGQTAEIDLLLGSGAAID